MSYAVKEVYYTLQGEGVHSGRPAVFCRFAGCNLWTGREVDRATAVCRFCDTEFVGVDGPGGGHFSQPHDLAEQVLAVWAARASGRTGPFLVCTGGEPLLQLDQPLIDALHDRGVEIAVETNGTLLPPLGIDWVCVSPKAGTDLVLRTGNELKLVYPQPGAQPEEFASLPFDYFSLQPMDGADRDANVRRTIDYCLRHPQWRLSLQTHKLLGLP